MKAYVIVRGTGEYSDRDETPVKVYLDQEKAQAVMAELEKIGDTGSEEYDKVYSIYSILDRKDCDWHNMNIGKVYLGYKKSDETQKAWAKVEAAEELIKKKYEELGFDAWYGCDWELVEAELVE